MVWERGGEGERREGERVREGKGGEGWKGEDGTDDVMKLLYIQGGNLSLKIIIELYDNKVQNSLALKWILFSNDAKESDIALLVA